MSIKLEGVDQLIKNIEKALLKNSPAEIRKACKRGAEMIVNAARSSIKHEITGTLSKSIKILPKWSGAPSATFVGPVYKRRKRKTGKKQEYQGKLRKGNSSCPSDRSKGANSR